MVLIALGVRLVRRTRRSPPGRSPAAGRRAAARAWPVWLTVLLGTMVTGSGPHAGDEAAARNGLDGVLVTNVHAAAVYATVAVTVGRLACSAAGRRCCCWRRGAPGRDRPDPVPARAADRAGGPAPARGRAGCRRRHQPEPLGQSAVAETPGRATAPRLDRTHRAGIVCARPQPPPEPHSPLRSPVTSGIKCGSGPLTWMQGARRLCGRRPSGGPWLTVALSWVGASARGPQCGLPGRCRPAGGVRVMCGLQRPSVRGRPEVAAADLYWPPLQPRRHNRGLDAHRGMHQQHSRPDGGPNSSRLPITGSSRSRPTNTGGRRVSAAALQVDGRRQPDAEDRGEGWFLDAVP